MPRARLSANGPEIAAPGYDVDTAPLRNMIFSPWMVAMRLALSGTVGVTSFTGYMDDYYYRGIVNFPEPFVRPPLVMVAGLNPDGSSQQSMSVSGITSASGGSSTLRIVPGVEIRTFADRFELYVLVRNGPALPIVDRPANWRYFVFQNTLDM